MYRWEYDSLARQQSMALSGPARTALVEFMNAAVLVDPIEYQRHPGEPNDPPALLRTLHFGRHGEGLVTFLIYPPDDLVLVVRLQWLGE